MAQTKTTDMQKTQESQLRQGVEPARQERTFLPATDIRETNESIIVTADMPGVKPDGVAITLEDRVLTVCGSPADEYRQRQRPLYAEYETGRYERSFSLSDEIDRDRIEARMQGGVLKLTLPKTRPSTRRIEVQAD